ncbi:MAG: hypothetical protein V4614_14855 [Pseudomonadota bacterium]
MTAITVKPFRGMVPRISDRLIAANQATLAQNCKITAGRLDPLKGPGLVHTSLLTAIATMYRYRHNGVDNWLVWNRVVDVVKSPTAQDALGQLFYTGDGEPRTTTFADAITGPGPYPAGFQVLGIAFPTVAATIIVTGGVAPTEERSYVYTFKNARGQESKPSPATLFTGNVNGSWDLSAMQTAPPNNGTITGAATVATGVVEVELNTVFALEAHEEVTFAGVVGMTSLNGTFALLSVNSGTNKVRVALDTAQVYVAGADTWTRKAPHLTAGMTKVIYRTVGNNVDYKRVAEIPVADTTYADTVLASALGTALTTIDSYTPPKDLHSLVALKNGSLAGLSGNQICFSEQYKPYSWPIGYRYAFSGTGVGLCAADNAVIVLTDGDPIIFTATVPEAATPAGTNTYAPCVAKRSIVDIGGGCIYAGHDGLYLATPSGVRNLTNDLYRNEEWKSVMPETFVAAFFDQRYYAMHQVSGGPGRILMLDLSEPDSIIEIDERVDALYRNTLDGKYYVAKNNLILGWDVDDNNRYLSEWHSRENQFGAKLNFTCAQVHADYGQILPVDTAIVDANIALLVNADNVDGAMCAAPVNSFAINGSRIRPVNAATARRVQFQLRVDGVVVFTKLLVSSKPFRLPSGFKSEIQGFNIAASIPVHSVSLAQREPELGVVS